MSKVLHNIHRLIHYSSLDVSICAAILAWPLAQYYCPKSDWVFILAISVQIIYVTDHIFDVLQKKNLILSERHCFIKEHLKLFMFVLFVLFFVNACLCLLFLNTSMLIIGFGLIVLVFIYFYNNIKLKIIPKEMLTAIIYAAGICLMPLYYSISTSKLFEILFLMIGISICTFINLISNNLFERNEDEANSENSFGLTLGILFSERILRFLYLLSFSCFIGSLFFKDFFMFEYTFSLVLISLTHLLIYKSQNMPILIKYRRSMLEWSFAIPGLIYLWL
jgi:1,4-dihydroxy-2-naphthoate octaprenyltransferase